MLASGALILGVALAGSDIMDRVVLIPSHEVGAQGSSQHVDRRRAEGECPTEEELDPNVITWIEINNKCTEAGCEYDENGCHKPGDRPSESDEADVPVMPDGCTVGMLLDAGLGGMHDPNYTPATFPLDQQDPKCKPCVEECYNKEKSGSTWKGNGGFGDDSQEVKKCALACVDTSSFKGADCSMEEYAGFFLHVGEADVSFGGDDCTECVGKCGRKIKKDLGIRGDIADADWRVTVKYGREVNICARCCAGMETITYSDIDESQTCKQLGYGNFKEDKWMGLTADQVAATICIGGLVLVCCLIACLCYCCCFRKKD